MLSAGTVAYATVAESAGFAQQSRVPSLAPEIQHIQNIKSTAEAVLCLFYRLLYKFNNLVIS